MATVMSNDPIHSKALPDLINKLLRERQDVLVLFNRLAATKPDLPHDEVYRLLRRFCQVLVDYVAFGHFEVYQCFEDHAGDTAHCLKIKRLARDLYPRIDKSTQQAIAFNDEYDLPQHTLVTLREDLSALGEQLATRIELEDRLIAAVNQAEAQPLDS